MNITKTKSVMFLATCGFIFCGPINASDSVDVTEFPIVIQGDEELKNVLEEALGGKGFMVIPGGKQKYHMGSVKPNPSIDYLIVRITPDPKVDYTIGIIDPETEKEISHLHPEILKEILRQLKKHHIN